MKIFDVDIDLEKQRDNTPAERAAIFAHLKGKEKMAAVAKLEEAMAKKTPPASTDK